MEPFIERMLERAKTKRILKEQFHAGHNIRERWNLLKNTNVLKQTEGKKRISVDKSDDSLKSKKMEADVDLFRNPDSFSKSNDDKVSNTLEKVKKSTNFTSNSQLSSRTELKNLPQTLIQLSGLVSNKILLFETKNMDTKTKVSTRTSFIERRAVFEHNKEETVLIKPKTRFTKSTLFEKSQEKNKSNTHLSEIEVAENNTCSTKYIDNADKESTTTTLDKKIKTEVKDNHYIQNNETDRENDSESIGNTSFGSSIMHVFDELLLSDKLKDSAESNSTTQEYLVLNEIDQCLDECLNAKELYDYDEKEKSSLKINTNSGSLTESNQDESERDLLEEKIKKLLDEIYIQEKKIEGASKALNFIQSTDEFNDSTEQVAGEWALLVATHKRQAALNEVQRLKQKDTLRTDLLEMQGCGSLTISAITLPLNQEYFQKMDTNTCLNCVCLMSHLGEVVATQAAIVEPGDSCLRFTSVLKLDNVYYNFRIDVKVYYFQTRTKCLSYDKKYHINRNLKAKNKSLKKRNQFIMPENLTGQNMIRSSVFQLMGITTIKLNDVNCKQFTLLGISSHSPLEGYLNMHILSKPSESVEHHGFLTLFEDIANLGNWRRRWYRLNNARLYYWLNPDDEHEKNPIGYVDLEDVFTKNVQFVNREKCARPYTFLLETSRPAQPGDTDSLIMKTNRIETTIEYFLLADTKEEGLQWISKLNKTLSLIRTWGPFRDLKS
ncbi:anillin-like [Linepithema humile]|uniref:anillin-like n=1 Tax=Linepithema humile TaxID=83485 RepID=UPI0006239161|nr:PREDICTED: actin-binding protein anillin-like [Linepithema humile]